MIDKEIADFIVERNSAFKKREEVIGGVRVCQYSYYLATYDDFTNPVGYRSIDARELRGLTFVENEDGSWSRTLFLNKFFNLNEVEETKFELLKNKKIARIAVKEDGSAVGFVKINGTIFGKTKFSFYSYSAVCATNILNKNKQLKRFVAYCLDRDLSPLFEHVSPSSQIVLPYDSDRLVLLQVRNNQTGEFLDIYEEFSGWDIEMAKRLEIRPLEEILEELHTAKDKEGYVITFEDGQMIKAKTKWYFETHRLISDLEGSISYVIKNIVEATIDDVLSSLPEGKEKVRETISDVEDVIVKYINQSADEVLLAAKTFDGDRRRFAEKYKQHPLFGVIMSILENPDIETAESLQKKHVLKKTFKNSQARSFLKEIGYRKEL